MLKSQRTTVYDRAQNNGGFITGPQHGLLGDSSRKMRQVDGGPETAESAAPNLRVSNGPDDCSNCAHYSMEGEGGSVKPDGCSKYDFSPEPFKVCDSHSTGEESPAAPEAAAPMMDDPGDHEYR